MLKLGTATKGSGDLGLAGPVRSVGSTESLLQAIPFVPTQNATVKTCKHQKNIEFNVD